jgi:serine/threonine protein kinase
MFYLIIIVLFIKKVAIKIMKPQEVKDKGDIEREINILKLLKHPNIVELYEAIHDEPNGKVYLVLELVNGGELFDCILTPLLFLFLVILVVHILCPCFVRPYNTYPRIWVFFKTIILCFFIFVYHVYSQLPSRTLAIRQYHHSNLHLPIIHNNNITSPPFPYSYSISHF